ncbi:MAG: hypothetical protein P1P86_13085 [Bacteroidales bacterium]|nr:hypothetical protein [Bacteroidales bacterium]
MVAHKHSVQKGIYCGRGIPGYMQVMLLPVLLLVCAVGLDAQRSPFDPARTSEAAQIREEVDFMTDRSFYVSGELIRFSARLTVSGPTGPGAWSRVLYVELLSVDGQSVSRGKYPVLNQVSSGEIRIPADLLTGNYLFRGYTRWMRNRGPGNFSYLPLRIINPNRPELCQVLPSENGLTLLPLTGVAELTPGFNGFVSSCRRGDSLTLELSLSAELGPDSVAGSLAVVPLSAAPSSSRRTDQQSGADFRVDYLPDRYGPSLSGTVEYPDRSGEGLSPAVIHLTLMSDVSGYLVCRSDSLGRFTLGLPVRSGEYEIFVLPEGPDGEEVEVRIDQDFDPRQVPVSLHAFSLTEGELKWATLMARNLQLSEIYGPAEDPVDPDSGIGAPAFYGTPTFSVDLDEYVQLPTLREVFINLIPGVSLHTRKGRTTLLIESENPSLSLYESLVMVDQVPVLDMEQFMSLSPAKIRQIDVVEDVYVKGDLRYGGLINLLSRDGDMAGIDLPEHSFFIDYLALQPVIEPLPDPVAPGDRMPDTRNTHLWLPDFRVQKGFPGRISFKAPDYPGEYVVFFRGQNDRGEAVLAETTFTVRED